MTPIQLGLIAFVMLLILMAASMPVHACFMLLAVVGLIFLTGVEGAFGLVGSTAWAWATHYTLATIPFFLLMGHFAFQSGISSELFETAQKWLGRLPGGLAIATTAACTMFAACTGSSVAGAATMGTIALPEMERLKYDKKLATGTVAAGGTLGILIPPSTHFIVYGILTETSIGRLFIAGILPGIMLSIMIMTSIYIRVKLNPSLGPPARAYPVGERLRSLVNVWGMLILFTLVIGGLYTGTLVPSEAGAVGATGALIIALAKKKLTKSGLSHSLIETGKTTAMIFAIIIGAMVYNNLMALSTIPMLLSDWAGSLPVPRHVVLIMIILLYIPLGMFMDTMAMTVLTLPIFFPVVTVGLGFDPVWFGVIHVLIAEMALITPPIGMNVYVISGVAKDVPMEDIFKGIVPFAIVILLGFIPLVAFPQISILLPNMMKGG